MTNTLTYLVPRAYFESLMTIGFTSFNPKEDADILTLNGVAHYFAQALEQHDFRLGLDVVPSVTKGAKVRDGKVELQTIITLTFKDEATALLFKLSHEGASA